jgi:hypothetical protein
MLRRPVRVPSFAAFALFASACTAHFTGALQIDGAPFVPTECRSGPAHDFNGIELADPTDRRLRIGRNVDGTPSTVYFTPGQQIGTNLGTCGNARTVTGFGTVNGVRNLDGTVTLACSSTTPRIEGQVSFENCR